MVQIAGKYELVENKSYYEMLLKLGYTEENAKKANDRKSTLDIAIDGNKIRIITDTNFNNQPTELILNQEVGEKMASGAEVKSTATQNGNVLTITSKKEDGTPGLKRVATFNDTGLELKVFPSKPDIPVATRIFKRTS